MISEGLMVQMSFGDCERFIIIVRWIGQCSRT